MDSITQIVLGAAVGEAVLGKKIGNRALIWGGIAGTIPDLDVFASGLFSSDMEAMAFHRGPSHSILFSVVFAFIIAYAVHRLYASGIYKKQAYKWFIYVSSFAVLAAFFFGIWKFVGGINNNTNFALLGAFLVLLGGVYYLLYEHYLKDALMEFDVPYKSWLLFFFLSLVTHPILDSFTSWGTLLYWPLADTRVAWNNISVADPFFTLPFLISVIVLSFFARESRWRRIINWAGMGFACLYMLWTFSNQHKATKVFEKYMVENNLEYDELYVSASILNNFLWFGLAQTDTSYVRGFWSTLDARDEVDRMFHTPKNHDLLKPYHGDTDVELARWFSQDYYQIIPAENDTLIYYDLRFGFSDGRNNYEPTSFFGFKVYEDGEDVIVEELSERPMEGIDFGKMFKSYIKRVRGLE